MDINLFLGHFLLKSGRGDLGGGHVDEHQLLPLVLSLLLLLLSLPPDIKDLSGSVAIDRNNLLL